MASEENFKHVNGIPKFQNKNSVKFIVPPEANVFYPTEKEFEDPLEYISKIHPIAEKTGICKIVPPENWQNPFTLNVNKFKFTARIQRLNQLDGETRLKLNFLDQLFQFWELQGTPLVIPKVQNKQLDLYNLHKLTCQYNLTVNSIKWNIITKQMGFNNKTDAESIIKHSFEHILQPYIVFNQLCDIKSDSITSEIDDKSNDVIEISDEDEPYKIKKMKEEDDPTAIEAIKEEDDPSAIEAIKEEDDDVVCVEGDAALVKPNVYRELKRLRFLGPGPKMNANNTAKRRRCNKAAHNYDESVEYLCCGCGIKGDESAILCCNGCSDKYHFTCIKPSLQNLPKGKWNCFKCTAMNISKPDGFGFEHSKEFTLDSFCEMAIQFKSNHFKCPIDTISTEMVEQEYWNLVTDIDSDVTVCYAADLHVVDHGSGFPRTDCVNLLPEERKYMNCGWNLNNLPILKRSLLRYINSDVSGMKVPWMYVGMCFATFCWHNEDHWLNSINFLHWGEPKTWYGVPGKDAEALETAWKAALPELFELQPDIQHQLVTIMNPNILMKANVPVYKLDQNQGEFVITFPRAYHMGFNQGFNFAEAVNFAPATWFKLGRECVLNYAQIKRFCVFSHDELLCTIASSLDTLNPVLASTIQPDMDYVIKKEEKMRKILREIGVISMQHVQLESLPDDKRHCEICKTTCYLSTLTCECNSEIVVCLDHYNDLCSCPKSKQVLKYRHTLDELRMFLANIEFVLEEYTSWLEKVEKIVNEGCRPSISELENLLSDANTRDYPDGKLYQALKKAIDDYQ